MRYIVILLFVVVASCKKDIPLCQELSRATVSTANQTPYTLVVSCDNTIYGVVEPYSTLTLDYYPAGTHVFKAEPENHLGFLWTVTLTTEPCSTTVTHVN